MGNVTFIFIFFCFKVEDLRSRLEESDCRRLELEAQLRTGRFPNQEICPTVTEIKTLSMTWSFVLAF